MNKKLFSAALTLGAFVYANPSLAGAAAPDVVDLKTWDKSVLSSGWSADALLGDDVYGLGGKHIGDVEDILVSSEGQVEAIIVETDAFFGIGDVHARVDWMEVSAGPEPDSVAVPVTERTLEDYRLNYDDRSPVRSWRTREFIGDRVALQDIPRFGVVDDVLFTEVGDLEAVIVDVDYGQGYAIGPYAYPYYGFARGWQPGQAYYDLPYSQEQITGYDPFDYDPKDPFSG